ncbi:MAG TPA: KUP/HAK/KT family potassium transporter, partial [Vicinamibacterales bacterium]|nr:KUP/HAK/KT family potassium transporter [Vicinamibacterales bacterium]
MTAKPKGATEPAGEPPPAQGQTTTQPPRDAEAGAPLPDPSGSVPSTTQTGFHASVPPQRHHVELHPTGKRLALLSLTALGIVYGDIGTSPLYALQQCFMSKEHPIAPSIENVYGVLSLIVWLLILVVAVKYLTFIMRADNRGQGGTLSLLALVLQQERRSTDSRRRMLLITLGLFGASLLTGEGIITPAISVLSAVEGLHVATPAFDKVIIAGAVVILFALFSVQRFGTGRVGTLFGPVMALWFTSIAGLGILEIAHEPRILLALNPAHGVQFFFANGRIGFLTLGAVVLAVTGAEALYADMGHFGKRPIRLAWFAVVLPALLLNYFGQGALLLRQPDAVSNPFYLLAPRALLIPLVVLATMAAVVASQALISGAFSLAQQAVQLGYSPRVTIMHTSRSEAGQIYVPEINKALMVGCLLLVISFRSSQHLGAAYGIAVTGTMAITSLLFAVVARSRWNWPLHWIVPLAAVFLTIDLSLFSANVVKIASGGWVPIVIALAVFTLMSTWKKGRLLLNTALHSGSLPIDLFLTDVGRR